MKRLTSNKSTKDMSMLELAHNSCYVDENHNARYRTYGLDIDSREYVRSLIKDVCGEDLSNMSDEEFDEYILEMFQYGPDEPEGLIALFYRNLWAMADLREHLKYYEDLDEQGKLVKLPCKLGDIIYDVCYENRKYVIKEHIVNSFKFANYRIPRIEIYCSGEVGFLTSDINGNLDENLFFTKSEAKEKLKELRGEEDGR